MSSKIVFGTGSRFGRLNKNLCSTLVEYSFKKGVRKFDTSFGGIGGSPFMAGSKGNIATEEAIYELGTLGYDCDIDINKVSTASRTLKKVVDSKYFYGELYKFDSV